jgi:protein ERP2
MAPPICGVVISLLCVVVMMSQPLLVDSYSNEYSFTFKLPPGKEQCFYEDMKEGESLELEYQVIEGGELDVNFKLRSPSGEIVSSDDHQMDGLQSYEVKEAGGYAICFDNSFSSISHKMIFVDLIIDTLEETPHEEYISADATMSPDDVVHDMKVIDIRASDISVMIIMDDTRYIIEYIE